MKRLITVLVLIGSMATSVPVQAQTPEQEKRWRQKTIGTLKSAATAEEYWRTSHDSYTTSLADLEQEGFTKPPSVRARVPWATKVAYCITAIHKKLEERWHYNSNDGRWKRGRCPSGP